MISWPVSVAFIHIIICFNWIIIIVAGTHLIIGLWYLRISLLEFVVGLFLSVSCGFHISFLIIINLIWFLKFNLFENFLIWKILWKWVWKITDCFWWGNCPVFWASWLRSFWNVYFWDWSFAPEGCLLLLMFLRFFSAIIDLFLGVIVLKRLWNLHPRIHQRWINSISTFLRLRPSIAFARWWIDLLYQIGHLNLVFFITHIWAAARSTREPLFRFGQWLSGLLLLKFSKRKSTQSLILLVCYSRYVNPRSATPVQRPSSSIIRRQSRATTYLWPSWARRSPPLMPLIDHTASLLRQKLIPSILSGTPVKIGVSIRTKIGVFLGWSIVSILRMHSWLYFNIKIIFDRLIKIKNNSFAY